MPTIPEVVSTYEAKIEQNKVSIKTLKREILELQETKQNTVNQMNVYQNAVTSAVSTRRNELNAAIPLDATTGLKIHPDYVVKWTYHNLDWTISQTTGSGNTVYGFTLPYDFNNNQVNRWAVIYPEVIESTTTWPSYNVGFSYSNGVGAGWNSSTYAVLLDNMTKWRLLFESISKAPGTDGAYGVDSQIASKQVAIDFLEAENIYMNSYIAQFG